jgi:hypothetical protein
MTSRAATARVTDLDTARMKRAFELVDPTVAGVRDWKAPIHVFGTERTINAALTALDVTLDDVKAAVEFYTATTATVEVEADGLLHIRAAGYRAGPAW